MAAAYTPDERAPILRECIQISLVSLTLMLFEVNLVRLFSILTFYHLAFFVLAIALFGIGLGGLYGQILRDRLAGTDRVSRFMPYLPVCLAMSVPAVVWILLTIPLGHVTSEGAISDMKWMLCSFLAAALPFFFGSLFISTIFAQRPQGANRLYFSDLSGASVGCLLAVPALEYLGGLATPFLAAAIGVLPIFLAAGSGRRLRMAVGACALAGIIVLAGVNTRHEFMTISKRNFPDKPDNPVLFSKWNFFSRIDVEQISRWAGWRPSRNYHGRVPDHLRITQDGRAPAFIVQFDGDFSKVEYLRYDLTAVPFYLTQPQKALVIGVGGGRDILAAKLFGVPAVKGVELNPTIVEAMRGPFREFSGNVYGMDGVDIVIDNGRTFANRDRNAYDLIFASLADTQVANAQGAYVLSENYLYTVEAFESYWNRLTPGGATCIVSSVLWGDQLTRLVGTAAQALENRGCVRASDHIVVVMTAAVNEKIMKGMCLMMCKSPVTPEVVGRAKQACEKLGYDLVWPPTDPPHEWTEGLGQLMDSNKRAAFLAGYPLDLSPLVDDRPYLFYPMKPKAFLRAVLNLGDPGQTVDLRLRAFHLLVDLFGVVFGCVLVLMFSPLLLFSRSELRRKALGVQLGFLAVFFLLGIGYMLVEVSVLQQLFLLLGDPTLTFAVTLCAMLAFTGLGSLLAARAAPERLWGFLGKAASAALALQIAVWLALPRLIALVQGAGLGTKFLLVAGVLGVLVTPMGMLFPSAIRLQARSGLNMTCWVWGMNGVGSVLGSVGATLVSMNCGIRLTFLAGSIGYACVILVICLLYLFAIRGAPGAARESAG